MVKMCILPLAKAFGKTHSPENYEDYEDGDYDEDGDYYNDI